MSPNPARAGGKGVRSGGGPPGPGRGAFGAATSGEFQVIAALQEQFEAVAGRSAPEGDLWIGDDAALVTDSGGAALLLATDLVIAGVHVDLDLCSLSDLGFKAIMVTVSDLAAMGATPDYLLVSIAAPPGTDFALLASGMAEAAADTGAVVVGGDLSTAPVVMVSVAVTGSVGPGPSSRGALTRSGARAGDTLFVTGPLGASAAGLRLLSQGSAASEPAASEPVNKPAASEAAKSEPAASEAAVLLQAHRRPVARLTEGATSRLAGATAAIDISDGLAADVRHLADASGVGVALDVVPVATGARDDEALGGGEDYELIVATGDPDRLVAAFAGAGLRKPIAIGVCTTDPEERTLAGADLPDIGWRHLFG